MEAADHRQHRAGTLLPLVERLPDVPGHLLLPGHAYRRPQLLARVTSERARWQ